jgi:hypothetical protein
MGKYQELCPTEKLKDKIQSNQQEPLFLGCLTLIILGLSGGISEVASSPQSTPPSPKPLLTSAWSPQAPSSSTATPQLWNPNSPFWTREALNSKLPPAAFWTPRASEFWLGNVVQDPALLGPPWGPLPNWMWIFPAQGGGRMQLHVVVCTSRWSCRKQVRGEKSTVSNYYIFIFLVKETVA